MSLLQITSQGAGRERRPREGRGLGKGDEPNLKLRHKAFLIWDIQLHPWINAHPLQPFLDRFGSPPPTSLCRHRAAVRKEHLSLSRAWEDAKRSHTSCCDAPGRAAPEGLSRRFQAYSTRTPAQSPESFLSQSSGTPVRQRGWSCTLVMFKGDGGKIKQMWGGGVGPEQGNGF